MKLTSDLSLSESLEKEREKLLSMLSLNEFPKKELFFIAIPENKNLILDIFPSGTFKKQPHFIKSDCTVIGIADSMENAKELSCRIINTVYSLTNETDLRKYFEAE